MSDMDKKKGFIFKTTYNDYFPLYKVFLDFNIGEPDIFRELFKNLEEADDKTKFEFILNTQGGRMDTTIQLIDYIRKTKAQTKAVIYVAMSSGSLIALACKDVIVAPFATMYIHNVQYGFTYGDLNKGKALTDIHVQRTENIFGTIYKGFLTDKEIKDVIHNGREIWLTENEIRERLEKRKQVLEGSIIPKD